MSALAELAVDKVELLTGTKSGEPAAAEPAPLTTFFVTAKHGSEVVLARMIKAENVRDAADRAERLIIITTQTTADDFASGRARITHIAEQP